ncbi:WD40-repeat-containing domain protein [Durotheca rogersii]|uniref:WD40-repeat-containing domain protein n=1 Tax=Durotheca rogersii TaxID=419775 RepID=UPI00221F6113|nr:WD40-repeat-containing domain protein [Durotheca rogersii]KAI5861008.1 WD40-repeat-containing domain protein [Durotheca rogersii]
MCSSLEMAPRFIRKLRAKFRRLREVAIGEPDSSGSHTTPLPTPSLPGPGLEPSLAVSGSVDSSESHATPSPSPFLPGPGPETPAPHPRPSLTVSTDPETLSLPTLPEKLWNQAYDELKASEPTLVETFEKILSAELCRDESSSVGSELERNTIGKTQETRCHQMQKLAQAGLDRTRKHASVKNSVGQVLQIAQFIKAVADPAVQAAPAVAVAWVSVGLVFEVISNPISEARSNRDGISYVLSRMEWYWSLADLLLDENKAEQSSITLRSQLEKSIVQLYGKLLSYQMKSICLYHRHWATVVARDTVKWDDWSGQLGDVQEAETLVKSDVEQYSNEYIKEKLRGLHSTAANIENHVKSIEDGTRRQTEANQTEKDNECLRNLHVTDTRNDKKRIEEAKGGLLRDSYVWILEHAEFVQFRGEPESQLLWIRGDPGRGKTMLLCGIIDELEKDQSQRVCYFFCEANEDRRNNATSVLRGLLFDLAHNNRWVVERVREKYDAVGKDIFSNDNAWHALTGIITAVLQDRRLDDTVVIIDALDECKTDQKRLLDFIAGFDTADPTVGHPTVKWIVSSRNWPDIEERLQSATQKIELRLESNRDEISQAVKSYIKRKVDELESLKKYDSKLRDDVESYLTANADGTFLWVSLICRELANHRKRHTLEKLESFPPGLGSLYGRMMELISSSSDARLCNEILAVTSVVYRPLTLDELIAFIGDLQRFDRDEVEEIIESCGSFLTLRDGIVSFVHQSAKDYLIENVRDQVLPFGIEHQHSEVFSRSLKLLSGTLKRDVYGLWRPGCLIDEVSIPDPDPLATVRYSCIFWVDHLNDSVPKTGTSDKGLGDGERILAFLRNNYLQWLEALSLMQSILEGVKAIVKLGALYARAELRDQRDLVDLIKDARRFILSHRRGIEMAPLQVYASALIFSPTNSLIRQLSEKPSWVTVTRGVAPDWDACLHTLEGHTDRVAAVAFSYDDQRLATGSFDKTIRIWDPILGHCIQILEGHTSYVTSIAFSPDNQRLASGSHDRTVRIWDTSGQCIRILEVGDIVNKIAFSPDALELAVTSAGGMIRIYTPTMHSPPQEFNAHTTCIVYLDNGRLASGSWDKTIKIWDTASCQCIQTFKGHTDRVSSITISSDSQRLISGSNDGSIRIWDTASGQCVRLLGNNAARIWSVVYLNDGRIVSELSNGRLEFWNPTSSHYLPQTLKVLTNSTIFSIDQWLISSTSTTNIVKVWDTALIQNIQAFKNHNMRVDALIFSHDGQRLASSSTDGIIKIWDVTSGQYLQTLSGHATTVQILLFSHDNQRLASSSEDGTIKIWDITSSQCLQTLPGHATAVEALSFSYDSQRLASGSWDGIIKIRDITSGQCLQTLPDHTARIEALSFSYDSQRLASGSLDDTIKIWDVTSGQCLQTLPGDSTATVEALSFSYDNQQLASALQNGEINIWDVTSGQHLKTLQLFPSNTLGQQIQNFEVDNADLTRLFDLTKIVNLIMRFGSCYSEYDISRDGKWILRHGKKILWLPPEYRPRLKTILLDWVSTFAVFGSTAGIGSLSGRISIIRFQ